MFDFSFWDVVKMILLWPFGLIYSLFKSFNPISYTKDNQLMNNLYDILEEIELFIQFLGKRPVYLQRGKMSNVMFEYYMDIRFLSSEFSKQRRIGFIIRRDEDHFAMGNGGNSGWGVHHYKKDNPSYDEIIYEIYKTVEMSALNGRIGWKEWSQWHDDTIKPILIKCKLPNSFHYVRKGLILATHEESNLRYQKAYTELMTQLNDEIDLKNFVKDIEGAYTAKTVMDALE